MINLTHTQTQLTLLLDDKLSVSKHSNKKNSDATKDIEAYLALIT